MLSKQTVSGSTQGAISSVGDYDSGTYRTTFKTNTGIGSGTYSLNDLLIKLVQMSHTHSGSSAKINCNCNCNCNSHSH